MTPEVLIQQNAHKVVFPNMGEFTSKLQYLKNDPQKAGLLHMVESILCATQEFYYYGGNVMDTTGSMWIEAVDVDPQPIVLWMGNGQYIASLYMRPYDNCDLSMLYLDLGLEVWYVWF